MTIFISITIFGSSIFLDASIALNRDDDRGSTDVAAVFAGHLPYHIIRKQSKRKIQYCQKSEDQKITKTANNNKIPPSGWKKYLQNVLQYRTVTGRPRKSGACFSVI